MDLRDSADFLQSQNGLGQFPTYCEKRILLFPSIIFLIAYSDRVSDRGGVFSASSSALSLLIVLDGEDGPTGRKLSTSDSV